MSEQKFFFLYQAIYKITGVKVNDIDQGKAELLAFLRQFNADDLVVDPEDLQYMIELCLEFSPNLIKGDVLGKGVINELERSLEYVSDPLHLRVGKYFDPTSSTDNAHKANKWAEQVTNFNPDIKHRFNIHKRFISFEDKDSIVFEWGDIRRISNSNEWSGKLVLHRINIKDMEGLIPQTYINTKLWSQGKKFLSGSFFTVAELWDLASHRQIMTFGNYQ